MMISFVWAEDENRVIGLEGVLPWHLPADLKFFKKVTMTGTMLMGRKTYESFPNGPLPGRDHIVLTRNQDYSVDSDQVTVVHSKEEALDLIHDSNEPVHIIGGANIFDQFKNEVNTLYRTVVHDTFDGDTIMPAIEYEQFELVSSEEGQVDDKNKYPHTYMIYKRK